MYQVSDWLTSPIPAGISLGPVTGLKNGLSEVGAPTSDCFLGNTGIEMCWIEGWPVAACMVLAMNNASSCESRSVHFVIQCLDLLSKQ